MIAERIEIEQVFTTKEREIGLGMSVCKAIVEAHGGHLRAENPAGGGTMLCLSLPAAGQGTPHPGFQE